MYDAAVMGNHTDSDGSAVALLQGWADLFWVAFEQSSTAMAITRDDHVIVAANQGLGSLTGYEPRQLIGQLADELVPGNWRRVRERDEAVLYEQGALDERREVLHSSGLRLRLRLVARRVLLAGQWLTLWAAPEDDGAAPHAPVSEVRARTLTPRELDVIAGLARGMRIREVADSLGISPSTATTHVQNATNKLQARSRTHLVCLALARELIDPNLVLDGMQT